MIKQQAKEDLDIFWKIISQEKESNILAVNSNSDYKTQKMCTTHYKIIPVKWLDNVHTWLNCQMSFQEKVHKLMQNKIYLVQ